MKISNDTIGNRTRDVPAWSAVPQLDAPSPASGGLILQKKFNKEVHTFYKNLDTTDFIKKTRNIQRKCTATALAISNSLSL